MVTRVVSKNRALSGVLGLAILMGIVFGAIGQLWLFWIAPIMGALLGAAIHHFIASEEAKDARPVIAPEVLGSTAILR